MVLIYYFQAKDIRHMNLPCFTLSKINPSKIGGLDYEIHLNPNMLIKWCAWNYCIEGGLINAIEGIKKTKITFNMEFGLTFWAQKFNHTRTNKQNPLWRLSYHSK